MAVLFIFLHHTSLQMQSDNCHQSYAEFICSVFFRNYCAQNLRAVRVNPMPLKG